MGAPAPLRRVRAHRVLRRLAGTARVGALAGSGHPIIRSFEPGEDWFWNYDTNEYYDGPELAAPECHPAYRPCPVPRPGAGGLGGVAPQPRRLAVVGERLLGGVVPGMKVMPGPPWQPALPRYSPSIGIGWST